MPKDSLLTDLYSWLRTQVGVPEDHAMMKRIDAFLDGKPGEVSATLGEPATCPECEGLRKDRDKWRAWRYELACLERDVRVLVGAAADEDTLEAVSRVLAPPEHLPGGCADCGRAYGNEHGFPDLIVPDDVWLAISPTGDFGGMLCPSCICKRVQEKFADESVEARFMSSPFANFFSHEWTPRPPDTLAPRRTVAELTPPEPPAAPPEYGKHSGVIAETADEEGPCSMCGGSKRINVARPGWDMPCYDPCPACTGQEQPTNLTGHVIPAPKTSGDAAPLLGCPKCGEPLVDADHECAEQEEDQHPGDLSCPGRIFIEGEDSRFPPEDKLTELGGEG